MRGLRAHGYTGRALRALRRVHLESSDQQQDEIADSLAAFIIDNHADPGLLEAVAAARQTLGQAGSAAGQGTPYARAGVRLVRIVESVGRAYNGGTFYWLANLADKGEAVRLLTGPSASPEQFASDAIGVILVYLGSEGETALRGLYSRDGARNATARRILKNLATERGWAAPDGA